jgi:polyisoprenoid-binding protein YceI
MKTSDEHTSTIWNIDPLDSTVGFGIRHFMVATVRGVFREVSGTVRYDPALPEATEIRVEIPTASIDTRVPDRDAHLRAADIFDVATYPTMTFRSKRARVAGAHGLEVLGDLTLLGTTREVALTVAGISGTEQDHRGKTRRGASATAKIKRSDFGLRYNFALEAGGLAIGDEVSINLDVSLIVSTKGREPSGSVDSHDLNR